MEKSASQQVLERLIPPLAVWALGRFLEAPRVKAAMSDVDHIAHKRQHKAMKSLQRVAKNARSNSVLLVAGAAAVVVGIGLLVQASRGK